MYELRIYVRKASAVFILVSTIFMPGLASAKCDEVPIISFDIELYAPESEATLASRAQHVLYAPSLLSNEVYWAAYKPLAETEYDSRNVRAIIKRDGGNIYIDRFGWVRSGNKYGKIDGWAFEKRLVSKCAAD
jgi:hypothetical protein